MSTDPTEREMPEPREGVESFAELFAILSDVADDRLDREWIFKPIVRDDGTYLLRFEAGVEPTDAERDHARETHPDNWAVRSFDADLLHWNEQVTYDHLGKCWYSRQSVHPAPDGTSHPISHEFEWLQPIDPPQERLDEITDLFE